MSVQRIAIVGAEKTGKSWLTHALAEALRQRGHTADTLDQALHVWRDREGPDLPLAHRLQDIAQAQAEAMEKTTSDWVISDSSPLMAAVYSHMLFANESLYPTALAHQARYDITLITGLDLPRVTHELQRDDQHAHDTADKLVRQALERCGIPYRVIYGQGPQRLNNALLALGQTGQDDAARRLREQAQFAINQGRTVWQCNECSDPECEHKLFSGLLERRLT